MNIILFNGKYTIFGAIISILAVLCLWHPFPALFGSFIYIIYLLFFGYYLGQFFIKDEKHGWQIFFGTIGVVSLFIISLTTVYWFYQLDKSIINIFLVTIPLLISLQKQPTPDPLAEAEEKIDLESYVYLKSYLSTKILILIVLFGQGLLFFNLLQKTYTDTLISPWTLFNYKFFLFFGFITFILLWILQKSKHHPSNLLLATTHTILILSIALIIFYYGFGFDPHIHQTAEKWIADNGLILPKEPYYLGQYVWVIMSHFISQISIYSLDKIIVPIGAGVFIPLSVYFALSRTNYQYKLFPAITLIPLIPLYFFTVTTPNNFALLLALVASAWIWYESQNRNAKTHLFGLLLTLAVCSIHPLIGLPLLVIYLGSILLYFQKQFLKAVFYPAYTLLLAGILPLTLYLNSWRSAGSLQLINPLNNFHTFWVIFQRPHYIFIERGDIWLKLLYYYRDWLMPLAVLIVIAGVIIAGKKYKNKLAYFFTATALGLFLSSLFITTSLKFAGVISYDQKLYGTRLLEMALVIMIPFFVITLREIFIAIKKQPKKQLLIGLLFSFLLTISLFFTYPTRDRVSLFTGYNVRSADLAAVHFIDQRNNGQTNYVVLSNQTVAVAALREFGFGHYLNTKSGEQYFYSIPTGGPLYQYFRKMVYEEPKRIWMEEAMKFAGVKKAYFIHTNYWAPAAEIRDKAKLEADNWWELAGGRVWIYEYLAKN